MVFCFFFLFLLVLQMTKYDNTFWQKNTITLHILLFLI